VSRGALYGVMDGTVFSLDAATGRTRWTSSTKIASAVSDLVVCAGIVFAGIPASDTAIPGEISGGVFGWDAATGELVWQCRHSAGSSVSDRAWQLMTGGDMIFAAHYASRYADLLAFKIG